MRINCHQSSDFLDLSLKRVLLEGVTSINVMALQIRIVVEVHQVMVPLMVLARSILVVLPVAMVAVLVFVLFVRFVANQVILPLSAIPDLIQMSIWTPLLLLLHQIPMVFLLTLQPIHLSL